MKLTALFRPTTLVAPAIGALLFSMLAIKNAQITITWYILLKVALGMFIMAMSNAAGNIINHVVDSYDTDQYHEKKRFRAIAIGEIDRMQAISLTVLIFGMAMLLSFLVYNRLAGLLMSVILLFSWIYSAPPRLKKRYLMGNVGIGTPRGMLGVVTAYAFFNTPTIPVLAFGFIMGLFVFGVNTTKDIGDYEADNRAGIKNFVTVLGINGAISFVIVPFLYIPYIIWPIFLLFYPEPMYGWLMLGVFMSLLTHVFTMARPSVIKRENHPSWYLFYAEMSVMILLFTVPQIL